MNQESHPNGKRAIILDPAYAENISSVLDAAVILVRQSAANEKVVSRLKKNHPDRQIRLFEYDNQHRPISSVVRQLFRIEFEFEWDELEVHGLKLDASVEKSLKKNFGVGPLEAVSGWHCGFSRHILATDALFRPRLTKKSADQVSRGFSI